MSDSDAGPGVSPTRALSATLVAGAVYDFAFAGWMLLSPESIASTFGLPLPGEPFYTRLIAIFLLILGVVYLEIARDPARLVPFVRIAIVGRLFGFVVLALSTVGAPHLAGLWVPATGDLAFAVAHAVTGWGLLR